MFKKLFLGFLLLQSVSIALAAAPQKIVLIVPTQSNMVTVYTPRLVQGFSIARLFGLGGPGFVSDFNNATVLGAPYPVAAQMNSHRQYYANNDVRDLAQFYPGQALITVASGPDFVITFPRQVSPGAGAFVRTDLNSFRVRIFSLAEGILRDLSSSLRNHRSHLTAVQLLEDTSKDDNAKVFDSSDYQIFLNQTLPHLN